MASHLPKTPDDFLKINGVGDQKLKKFGEKFMGLIKGYK
jgi:superfamily II DNA helicase RecQ